jgi:hypothetical protein
VTLVVLRKADKFWVVEVKKNNLSRAALADDDGDEIPAVCDQCVCLAGGLENKGAHLVDACPCGAPDLSPDTDGDGTPDKSDKCLNQFGEPEDGGCPNYTENELTAIARIEEAKRIGADLLDLKYLSLKRLPSAIKQLTGLKNLDLNHNQMSDVSILQELKQLTHLDLSRNRISNLSLLGLQHLKQVTNLRLEENYEISDLSALLELKQLIFLDLDHNQMSDVSILQELKQLTVLDLSYNKIQNFNLDLNQLPNLKYLRLYYNPLQNIPKEIIGGENNNCLDALRAYQKQQRR